VRKNVQFLRERMTGVYREIQEDEDGIKGDWWIYAERN